MAGIQDQFWEPRTPVFNLDAEYALGVLELVAYHDDLALLSRWAEIFNMSRVGVVQTPGNVIPNMVYAGHADRIVIAIPGTTHWQQMLNNIIYSAQRENEDFGPGRMHSFFLYCAEQMVPFLQSVLTALPTVNFITFVGHSLGGAVAQLLADWVAQNTGRGVKLCCTFNSPRVGDWTYANRSRYYKTHNYYCAHDLVCELPPIGSPSTTSWQVTPGVLDIYQHRDHSERIESFSSVRESWWAIGVTKFAVPVNWGITAIGAAESAQSVMKALGFIGSRAAIASWVLPLPAWVNDHLMRNVLFNIEGMTELTNIPEYRRLKEMFDYLVTLDSLIAPTTDTRFALAPPVHFQAGEVPPPVPVDDLPAPTPGERFETIEAAFEWMSLPPYAPVDDMFSVDDSFIAALTTRAAVTPGGNPLTSPGQITVDLPPRPHWYFRGPDRDLLQKIAKAMDLLELQDLRRYDDTPATGISTRDPIVPFEDDEFVEALALIRQRVSWLLTLQHLEL